MKIAFASGKGGTGKTLLSTAFARLLAAEGPVTYVDADVEEPNGHLLLKPEIHDSRRFTVPLPTLKTGHCSGCGACQKACAFNAILTLKNRVMVFAELCHSCGGCLLACPEDALTEEPYAIGELREGLASVRLPQREGEESPAPPSPIRFIDGVLDIGQARSTPLVEAVVDTDDPLVVVDCPPGTSCPVVAAIRQADKVVLVTEPTPFGLHDLQLAVAMCREIGLDMAVVINRSDLGDEQVVSWLESEGIVPVAHIPFDRDVAEAYARGIPAEEQSAPFRQALLALRAALLPQAAPRSQEVNP